MSRPTYSSNALLVRLQKRSAECVGNDSDSQAHYMVGWLAEALVTILNRPNSDVDYLKDLAKNSEASA